MRKFLILIFLVMMARPSWAGSQISVAQLEQALKADTTAHKPDAEIARQIRLTQLSERLTETTFDRLNKQFAAGSQAALALRLLADRSSFLDPPASELPTTPPPDTATQQHLLEAAQRFVLETLPRLPNFFADRTTLSFNDSPQEVTKGWYPERMGLHLIGTSKAEVSVRNEQNPFAGPTPAPSQTQGGLVTWGEFGSALLIIMSDSSHGKITWAHWEQTSSGQVAVFHYEVPKAASHYEIVTPVDGIRPRSRASPSPTTSGMVGKASGSNTTKVAPTGPGYHGSLWVDPATGAVLRLSLVANLSGSTTFDRVALVVEYGPVKIADKTFICPVRSLALSSAPPSVNAILEGATTEWLNENLFTHYHMFAATSRILTESAEVTSNTPDENTRNPSTEQAVQQAPITAAPFTEQASTPLQPQPAPVVPPTASPAATLDIPPSEQPIVDTTAVAPQPPANESPVNSPARPDPVNTPPSALQPSPVAQSAPLPDTGNTIHVGVNEVLVPVVVRDQKGLAVGGLVQGDFRVLDRGKPRAITGFTLETSAATPAFQQAPESGSDRSIVAAQTAAAQARYLVFLFDDRHLNLSDLAITQTAATKMLDDSLGAGVYADVLSFTGVNSGITRDRVALKAAIMQLKAHPLYQSDDHDCPSISAYAAHQIIDLRDDQVLGAAISQAKSCSNLMMTGGENVFENMVSSAANRALAVGQEDARETLNVIENVVRAMAKLPGQRTLILISPGFFSDSPETVHFKSDVLNQAAAANVIISALDARGMVVDTIGDDHVMSELASGTGGTFFDHSNDLEGGLKSLTVPPEFLYLLELSLKGVKPDGSYHQLQVKVIQPGLHVQARRGYVAAKPGNAKK